MGCFDSVYAPCPKCGTFNEFQSKGGECLMRNYMLNEEEIPDDVMSDVNRHSVFCESCNNGYKIKRVVAPIWTTE
jgi:hypothetical protein